MPLPTPAGKISPVPERIFAVVGIGNLRCGPPILATFSRFYPDYPLSLRLYDANEERLDLMDQLGRMLIDQWNSEVNIRASSDLAETLNGITDLILCLSEDCARRMAGHAKAKSLEFFEDREPEAFFGGDPNRPTPINQLSERTRRQLVAPTDEGGDRAAHLAQAWLRIHSMLEPSVRILNLTRGLELPAGVESTYLDWPPAMTDAERAIRPHQILRFIKGDERIEDLIVGAEASPLMNWLRSST